jgi:hypothetical protein
MSINIIRKSPVRARDNPHEQYKVISRSVFSKCVVAVTGDQFLEPYIFPQDMRGDIQNLISAK